MEKIQSAKGIHDILPQEVVLHRFVQQHVEAVLHAFGYKEIRLPILENTALFKRSIGDTTDIVEKEMYTFTDSGGATLSLRPEGTASCVRACIQHGFIGKGQQQRLWYGGPFFRRERPQKARYRQFYQIGAEIFNCSDASADIELLLMFDTMMERLIDKQSYALEINTLGSTEARSRYCKDLQAYFEKFNNSLSPAMQQRVKRNPLRVLDSKDPQLAEMIANAPSIDTYLDKPARAHFDNIQEGLRLAGVAYRHNPRMVRGLDYYSGHVFEFIAQTSEQAAAATICAGGRYDGLAQQIGGSAVPAAGFAFGLNRFIALYEEMLKVATPTADIYVVCVGTAARRYAMALIKKLHAAFFALQKQMSAPSLPPQILMHLSDDKMTTQLKRANKLQAKIALIFAEDEIRDNTVSIKLMRDEVPQQTMSTGDLTSLAKHLAQWL